MKLEYLNPPPLAAIALAACVLVASGCIFSESGSGTDTDAGDAGTADAVDASEPDGGDAQTDVDVSSALNCPQDCSITAQYRDGDGSLADLDEAALDLFQQVELVATVEGQADRDPTGCQIEWSLSDSGDRPRLQLEESTDAASLVPVALASGGEQVVTARAMCNEGEVETTVSPSITYPAKVPEGSDGQPAPLFWWSAASNMSAGAVSGADDVWEWRTVDPSQDFFLGIPSPERVPTLVDDGDVPLVRFDQDSTLATRIPSNAGPDSHIQPEVSIFVRLRIDQQPPNGTPLPIIESCTGPNNQLRYTYQDGGNETLDVAFQADRVDTPTAQVIGSQTWVTVGMVWDNQEAMLYLNQESQNTAPLVFDGSNETNWAWDSLFRGCNLGMTGLPVTVDVSDVVVLETALAIEQVSTIIEEFIGARTNL